MEKQFENSKLRFTVGGLLFGILFSLLIIIITIAVNNYSFNFQTVIDIILYNEVSIILLLSPILIVSVVGYFVGTYADSLKINRITDQEANQENLDRIYSHIEALRRGKSITGIVFSESDKIEKSLINLSNELEKGKTEDESRKKEEFQRSWTSEGLALFGAVLREYNDNIEVLANKVISELVKYIDANQAGFYVTDLSDPNNWAIKEKANFAYGRKRLADKEFQWGEGLIGACIVEKKTTVLKNISDNYFEIESGLGSAKPGSVLLVPIMTEEGMIHGALEIASFKIYEDYEIKFVEQIAESIATTISTLKINEETSRLLQESREQAIVLTRQEDELRKTISDMKRLQENADIQSIAFRAYQDSTNRALIRAEFSNNGELQFANKRFLDIFGYKSNAEIQNEHISKFVDPEDPLWFNTVSNDIINNDKHFEGLLNHVSKTGTDLWIESSYIGLRNDKGKVEKILFLGIDATDLKIKVEELQNKIDLINNSVFKLDLSPSEEITLACMKFVEFLGFNEQELIHKNIFDFIPDEDKQHIRSSLDNVKTTNNTFEGDFSFKDKENNTMHFYCYIFSEKDENENIIATSIILFDYNQEFLSKQKTLELEQTVKDLNKDIEESRERFNRRLESARDEMKELFSDIETENIFFETALSLLPDAVITIDSENTVVYINESVLEIWDSLEDLYTGNNVKSLFPELENNKEENYLGNLFDINLKDKILGDREKVFIIDSKGNKKYLTMLMVEANLGLRRRLTVFLQE